MRPFHDYFWGVLLIVAGIIFLLRQVFHMDIPVFRTIVGIIFVYIGISIVFGGYTSKDNSNMVFSNGTINSTELQKEYNIVFSNGDVDISDVMNLDGVKKVKVNCVFGNGTLVISKNQTVVIKMTSAFGQVISPDNSRISFGDTTYKSKNSNGEENCITIEATAVFGKLRIVEE